MNEIDTKTTNLVPRAFSLREKGKALETRLEQERAYSGIQVAPVRLDREMMGRLIL